jgi:hypothetical protein
VRGSEGRQDLSFRGAQNAQVLSFWVFCLTVDPRQSHPNLS